MDEIDIKILQLLQKNGRMSLKTIAEHTYLSSPAVSARKVRLEKSGVITGYHASVNPEKLGCQIMAYVSVAVSAADQPAFFEIMGGIPNILDCSCVTGEYSILLKTAFADMAELDAFVYKTGRFGRTKTQIVTVHGPVARRKR